MGGGGGGGAPAAVRGRGAGAGGGGACGGAGGRVAAYTDPAVAFDPFNASIATGTDRTNLVKVGGQWTHLFGSSVEGNINGGFVQSFATHSGIVATVTGDGVVVPTIGNQSWFEY